MKPLFLTSYDEEFSDLFWKDWLPGYTAFLSPHFELRATKVERQFGTFGSLLYNTSCRKTIGAVTEELRQNPGRIIVVADCDMRIFRDFWPVLEMMAQRPGFFMATAMDRLGDEPVHCAGFVVVRAGAETAAFFEAWWKACDGLAEGSVQGPFNALIRAGAISCGQLPDSFWTPGLSGLVRTWEPGDPVPPPPPAIALAHANFCVGAKNKRALLASVSLLVQATRRRRP